MRLALGAEIDRQLRLCYFDRTLAALAPRPFAIGVGFEFQRLETIHPQPFDIPMDLILTEACNLSANSTTLWRG